MYEPGATPLKMLLAWKFVPLIEYSTPACEVKVMVPVCTLHVGCVVTDADGVDGSAVTVTVLVAVALEQPPVPVFV